MTDAKHEAPAEGAGEDFYAVGEFIGRQPVLCVHGSTDPNNLCPYCEGEKIWGGRNFRARSSAPEAREVLERIREMDFKAIYGEANYQKLADDLDSLFTHPAALSADKLRIAVEALEKIKLQSEDCLGVRQETTTAIADQALAALKAEGAK